MRLLDAQSIWPGTPQLREYLESEAPPYAIMSHTWGKEEVLFEDITNGIGRTKSGFVKIRRCCELALRDGLSYVWVDTCCIDKRSSAELTEAINSMFRWYQLAERCYAFLEDIEPVPDSIWEIERSDAIFESRWMTRGFTLQELIAPKEVLFLSRDWVEICTRAQCAETLSKLSNIDLNVLREGPAALPTVSIARRMSWASKRATSRPEDIAYCLLGIFDVQMPLLYGEGEQKAFMRLQEEIIKTYTDQSILAWTPNPQESREYPVPTRRGTFAEHPREFYKAANIVPLPTTASHEYYMKGVGLQLSLPIIETSSQPIPSSVEWGLIDCQEEDNFIGALAIPLLSEMSNDRQQSTVYFRHPILGPYTLTPDVEPDPSVDLESRQQVLTIRDAIRHVPWSQSWSFYDHVHSEEKPRTIFLPKVPTAPPRIEHVALGSVGSSNKLIGVYPIGSWQQAAQILGFRGGDNMPSCGAFVFRNIFCSVKFALLFGVDHSYTSPVFKYGYYILHDLLDVQNWLQQDSYAQFTSLPSEATRYMSFSRAVNIRDGGMVMKLSRFVRIRVFTHVTVIARRPMVQFVFRET